MNPTHQPRLRILNWPFESRPLVHALGPYCETYWLPVLRPAAYLLGRRLVILSERAGVHDGKELVVEDMTLAFAVGLAGEEAPGLRLYHRALDRLVRFRLARFHGANLEIRSTWPRIPGGQLARLPEIMQHAEPEWWALSGGEQTPEFIER